MEQKAIKVGPYLMFNGRCEEALEFYQRAIGAEIVTMMRFRDNPAPTPPGMLPPGSEDKIMHASFTVGGDTLMASDGECGGDVEFKGVSISLSTPDKATAERMLQGLAEGGQVRMPLRPPSSRPASACWRTALACPG
jgi:PhnB protein